MKPWLIVLLALVGIVLLVFLFYILPNLIVASILYKRFLVRDDRENKWTREPHPDDEEEVRMYELGKEFESENKEYRELIDIYNEGYHLFGEYFNFGYDKAVIVIPGRTEGLRYSYFFSKPYKELGYNVLVIDNRCHGYSDGKYSSLGLNEHRDILAWGKTIHDKYNLKEIILHAICIGSATGLYALTSKDCPSYMAGLVADGMYVNFVESFYNHVLELGKKVHPVCDFLFMMFKFHTGCNPYFGPIDCIGEMTKPMLFLYTKEDKYSLPEKGVELYEKCASEKKKLVWFDHGVHSHIRINAIEKYDNEIKTFIKESFGGLNE